MNIKERKKEIKNEFRIKAIISPLVYIIHFSLTFVPIYLVISFILNQFNPLEWNIWFKVIFSAIFITHFFSFLFKYIDVLDKIEKEYEKLEELEKNLKENDGLIQIIENTSQNNHFFNGNININHKKTNE